MAAFAAVSSGGLSGEGSGFTGTTGSPGRQRRGLAQGVAAYIGHSDHGVVEGGADMHLALLDILALAALTHHFLALSSSSHCSYPSLTSSCWRPCAWAPCGYGRWSCCADRGRAGLCDASCGSSRSGQTLDVHRHIAAEVASTVYPLAITSRSFASSSR